MGYIICSLISAVVMLGILFYKKKLLVKRLKEELCFKYGGYCTDKKFERELRYNIDTYVICFFVLSFLPIVNIVILLIWLYKNHILDFIVDSILKIN